MTLNLTVSLGLFCKQNMWLWRIYIKRFFSRVTAPVSGESKQHGTGIYEDSLAMCQHGRRTEREPPFCREGQAHKVTLLPPKPTQLQESQLTPGSHCSPLGPASFQEPSTSAPLPDEVSLWTRWQHATVKWHTEVWDPGLQRWSCGWEGLLLFQRARVRLSGSVHSNAQKPNSSSRDAISSPDLHRHLNACVCTHTYRERDKF